MKIRDRVAVLVTVIVALSCRPAAGQGLWTEASTLGYGGIGVGLATAACWSCEVDTALGVIVGGAVLGMLVGNRIGASAEEAAQSGRRPNSAQLLGARVGTVTGFATFGVGLAGLYANASDRGRDEDQLLFGALAGAAIGALVEVMQERNLPEVEAQPSTGLSLLPSGFGGLSIRFTRRTW